jgi:hypothetical protein
MANSVTPEEKEKYKINFEKDIIHNELMLTKLEILNSLLPDDKSVKNEKNIIKFEEIVNDLRETSKNLSDEQIESMKKFDRTHDTYYDNGLLCIRPKTEILQVEFKMEKIEQQLGRVVRLNKNNI